MATGRTSLLNLPLPTEGELDGSWGDMVNKGLTEYLDIAIAGVDSLTSANFPSGALTLANTTGTDLATNIAATSAQYATIRVSSLAQASTITAPSSSRSYRIINDDATYSLTIKASGQTGVTFSAGQTGIVAFNGTDYALVGTIGPTVPVARGGTGATTLTANNVILGNGTSAVQFVAPGNNGNVLTSNGTTWTSAALSGVVTPSANNAFTGANTFYNATGQTFAQASTNDGIILQGRAGGSSSYRVTFTTATLSANRTLTFPDATDTAAVLGTAQTFTAAQTFRAASAIRSEAASTQDAVVIAGRAGGTSSYAITLTPATLSASRTLTLPEPGENVTLGYQNIPQNSQSAAYQLVLTDAGKHILHPSADTSARTFTIPANGTVNFPIGTAITFINQNGAGVVTIAITTDTMRLAGAGTTGSRTLAANGVATAIKIATTEWIISGTGLT